MDHPTSHTYSNRRIYPFRAALGIFIVALVSVGAYIYLTGTRASGTPVGVAVPPNAAGYWTVTSRGCLSSHGVSNAGDLCSVAISSPIVGIASTPSNNTGYWLVQADGKVNAFGGAKFAGSVPSGVTNIRAMAAGPGGAGYWLLRTNGQVYNFGGVAHYGNGPSASDYVGIAGTNTGHGYWLLRQNGQVYAKGDARGGNPGLGANAVSIASSATSYGYWVLHSNGAVSNIGSVANPGNMPGTYIAITRRGSNNTSCVIGLQTNGGAYGKCPTPVVSSLTASPSTVASGAASILSWASSYATNCTLAGVGSVGTSGSRSTGALSASKTFTMSCGNFTIGAGPSKSVTVSVTPKPKPGPNPSPTPTQPKNGGGSTSRSSSSTSSRDTAPPSAPGNFTAQLTDQVVELDWIASTDSSGVDHYTVDRSLDQTAWTTLDSNVSNTTFTDQTAGYGTTYYYRVRAIDLAGNASAYATAQVTTGAFEANAQSDESVTLTSDDNQVTVSIPTGAVDSQADCSIISDSNDSEKLPLKKTALVAGPYSLICKAASGDLLTDFKQDVTIKFKLTTEQQKRYKGFTFYAKEDGKDSWVKFKAKYDKKAKQYSFTSKGTLQFAVLGKVKKGLSAQTIILLLMFLAALGGVVYYLYRRQQQSSYQDYIRKKYYNL